MDINQKLSEHFTLLEFTYGGTQMPPTSKRFYTEEIILEKLSIMKFTATQLEKVRELLGNMPLKIHCGLRPYEWELYRKRSGKSQHVKGNAIDFSCPTYGDAYSICQLISKNKATLKYDQLIHEHQWIHLSFVSVGPRMQDLTLNLKNNGYDKGILK
jgi:zinc D-Ala-D-Ala carboxypeptidase